MSCLRGAVGSSVPSSRGAGVEEEAEEEAPRRGSNREPPRPRKRTDGSVRGGFVTEEGAVDVEVFDGFEREVLLGLLEEEVVEVEVFEEEEEEGSEKAEEEEEEAEEEEEEEEDEEESD
jgi:hypothetical protein